MPCTPGKDSRAAEEAELFVKKLLFTLPDTAELFENTACFPYLGAGFFYGAFRTRKGTRWAGQ
jgi:hypothetical protein